MKPVRLSPMALADVEDIGERIARDDPSGALAYIESLTERCRLIGRFPEAFELQPAIAPTVRRAVHGRLSICHSVLAGEVRIERILHGPGAAPSS